MYEGLFDSFHNHISLTEIEKETVLSLFTFRSFRKKQYILQEGDICRNETFVLKGLTRTYEVDEKGQEHVLQFGPENWWVGDLLSFLSEQPTHYNIDCIENCEVIQINKINLNILYEKVPKMERYFRILLQNAFIATNQRILSNLSKTANIRYEDFLLKYPQLENRLPNHQIASFLGITPQSLSRIRNQYIK